MHKRGGDDLEDDFIPDELVAYGEGDDGYFDIADNWSGLIGEEEEVGVDEGGVAEDPPSVSKKRKRRQKEKEKRVKKAKLVGGVTDPELPSSTAAHSPSVLADYLSSMQKKTFSAMSQVELDDIRIPESSIVDTVAWTKPRALKNLADFIAEVLPKLHKRLSQKSLSNGAPTLIFMTGAALRAADVTRILRDKNLRGEKGGEVAKLFARHFKVEEHVVHLQKTKVGAAVGTPGRIGKLLCDTDALALTALTHVILDVTFRDAKQRSLLDIPEVRDDVFKTVLGCPKLIEPIKAGKVQVILF